MSEAVEKSDDPPKDAWIEVHGSDEFIKKLVQEADKKRMSIDEYLIHCSDRYEQ